MKKNIIAIVLALIVICVVSVSGCLDWLFPPPAQQPAKETPSAPENFQAVGGNGYVVLTWNAPSSIGGSPITNYKIYRGTTSGGETYLATTGNVLTYNDTTVINDVTYYYKVSAVNSVGEGATYNEVSAIPHPQYSHAHAPIRINSNSNFTSASGVTSGSGTQSDPYIIEGWDINARTADGIRIENTDAYFIIRNCVVHDGKRNYPSNYGIYFYNVTNSKIDNTTSYNNSYGIYLYSSSNNNITNCDVYNNNDGIYLFSSSNNNQITNCSVYNNYLGIYLDSSSNNLITNCDVYNNSFWGIYLDSSSNNYITNNIFTDDGIIIYGNLDDCVQTIANNTVNGKPLYYFLNRDGITLDSIDVGQLILVNCTNFNIKNLDISYTDIGIQLLYSSNNQITNCTVYKNYDYGIELYSASNNNQITNCDVYNNSHYGIYLSYSSNNTITNCNVYKNYDYGIELYSASNNNITKSYVYNNDYGIELSYSSNNQIHYCDIYDNTNYGVESDYSVNATYNWWGSASGPYHSSTNPSGTGNNVSNGVTFNPWLTEPWTGEIPVQPTLTVTVNANPTTINSGETSTITITVKNGTNPVTGATINLQSNNGGGFSSLTDNGDGTYNTTFTAPTVTTQTICRITATASKTGYNNGSGYVDVTMSPVTVNHAPIVNTITANPTTVSTSGTVTVTIDASDADVGDTLTYYYDCTGGTISGSSSTVTWTAPNTAGDYTVTVYVNDSKVNSNSKSVSVTVTSPEKEKPKGFIPGFEVTTFLVATLGVCVLLLRRRKR